ncbi:MAG: NAD(P)/FAD-dependent oxidoreductase, partial [Promethearchaeota archaeon]
MTYDVIVVGAGPAGSTAAYDCSKQGLKTLLLEKYKLPREKPCGGAVMYRALRIIEGKMPRDLVEQKIYGLRFILPDGKKTEFISDKMIGITVFRDRFDEFL